MRGRCMFPYMSSESYHEPIELLSQETQDTHRALVSLKEELEAVDWYQQRAEACSDPELSEILIHNKNEEVEHAMMTLEWLRRRIPVFADNVDMYIKSNGKIIEVEELSTGSGEGAPKKAGSSINSRSLGIGSLKGKK